MLLHENKACFIPMPTKYKNQGPFFQSQIKHTHDIFDICTAFLFVENPLHIVAQTMGLTLICIYSLTRKPFFIFLGLLQQLLQIASSAQILSSNH